MKKSILFIILFLLVASVALSTRLTNEEKALVRECKSDCNADRRVEFAECKAETTECRNECKAEYETCEAHLEGIQDECLLTCDEVFEAASNTTDRSELAQAKREHRQCKTSCKQTFRLDKREQCDYRTCKKACTTEGRSCSKEVRYEYSTCRRDCPYTALNDNITCVSEFGVLNYKDKALIGCDACECRANGEMECKPSLNCHFEDFDITQEACEDNGGYYHYICSGSIYATRCGFTKVCQCAGDFEYTCPSDYTCLDDFHFSDISPHSDQWSKPGGHFIGDIGVCAKNPDLSLCGNGVCDNIVRDGEFSAETILNCPQDCAISVPN